MNIVISLNIVLAIVCMESRLVSMVRIKMDTLEMKGWELNAANISCLAENLEWPAKQIISIQLLGPGNTIIANLDHDSNISIAKDLYLAKTEVHGKMEKEIWRSYLTVTMYDILTSHSGMYTCNLYFYDQQGFVREDIASNNLDAGKQDPGQVMMYMMSRISTLEEELGALNNKVTLQTSEATEMRVKDHELQNLIANQSLTIDGLTKKALAMQVKDQECQDLIANQSLILDGLTERVSATKVKDQELRDLVANKSLIIDGLTERDNFMTAFSAGYSGKAFSQGSVVLFNKMHFQVGDGYNTNTGLFKAPRAGFYVFNLIVMYHGGSELRIVIVANDQPVATTYTVDNKYYRQSSVSAIVKLEVGDVVKPVFKYASDTRSLYNGYPFTSEFIGYILKAL